MAARIFLVNLKAIGTIIMLITINLPSVLTLQKAADIFRIVMCFAIWYHSYNFKNEKNADGEVLLFVKFQFSISIPPENVTKPKIFLSFSEGIKMKHRAKNGLIM